MLLSKRWQKKVGDGDLFCLGTKVGINYARGQGPPIGVQGDFSKVKKKGH